MVLILPPLDARRVKQRCNFVAIVSRYTRLRRTGRQFVGLCPLHPERHPSFYVHPGRRIFHCFGCGAGGDVFNFVMRAEECDFRQALELVEEFSNRGSERGPAVFAGTREQGAKPPGLRSRPPQIARKPEPSRFFNALHGDEAELPGGCAAERAALLLEMGE